MLQHAHNPVNWFPWGEEALALAKSEDKPILVSIGYAACHWCHVMEHESFENEAVAAIMNEHFINIKIDREERPDLDHIYMDAVQAMTGSGGWPLNVFLTPDAKPFYGGTYFPPIPAHGRASWTEVLQGIAQSFKTRREQIESQATNLTGHLEQSNSFGIQTGAGNPAQFTKEMVAEMAANLIKTADTVEGGFGRAPKFPQTFSITFLLQHYFHTGHQDALKQALLSLDKMIGGGIYDQLQGGFARYSTDAAWLVPHFEKMLYDNALLIQVLCDAYQITKDDQYKRVVEQTLAFIQDEWKTAEGGYCSAYDADSEGEEGKYYVWTKAEVEAALGTDAALFCEYFDVTEEGNWEGVTILNTPVKAAEFCAVRNLDTRSFRESVEASIQKLLEIRSKRIKPLLDDKILLGWNAMLVQAFAKAYAALGAKKYLIAATELMSFLESKFDHKNEWKHSYKNGTAKIPAFLDDYAAVIKSYILLQEITGEGGYLVKARDLTNWVVEHFSEPKTGYFFYTHANQGDVIVRKKEVYDGATPSGNALMAHNLYYLGIVFNNSEWRERSVAMVGGLQKVILSYPGSFGVWAQLLQGITYGIPEIALVGSDHEKLHSEFLRTFIPLKVYQSAPRSNRSFPLLAEKSSNATPQFYLCKHFVCYEPVNQTDMLIRMLKDL